MYGQAAVQTEVIRLLEYVICQLDLLPAQELGSISLLLQGTGGSTGGGVSFHTRKRLMMALMKWIDLKGAAIVEARYNSASHTAFDLGPNFRR